MLRFTATALAISFIVVLYYWWSTDIPSADQIRARAGPGNTQIRDRYGRLLYLIPDPRDAYQTIVPLDSIPVTLREATIAVEDSSFYHNAGFDLRGMLRAAWANLRAGRTVAGGSTITQQVARNLLLDSGLAQQRTLDRKLREVVVAVKLTSLLTKDEILALYLNQTYYSERSYGVEAAAQQFFGKPVDNLSLAECAVLAGLPQAPARYNPLTHGEQALARQRQVLDAMVKAGFISETHAQAARDERLTFVNAQPPMRAPHFVQYVLRRLQAVFGTSRLAQGGLIVTTTLDVDLYERSQALLQRQSAELSMPSDGGPGHNVRNGAVVVIDPADGAILALVGSPSYDDISTSGQVNAALAPRQPGSAIKPLTYAAAFERGWSPATTVLDIPSTFPTREGRLYTPQNYDRQFHGPLSVREALATSSNVAAVRTLDAIGVPALLEMAERLGITTLGHDASRYGLPLTLGDGEVTLLELTNAYATFANGGHRVRPYAIMAIHDARHAGSPALDSSEDAISRVMRQFGPASPTPVLSPAIAYLISDILSDHYVRMRAFGAASPLDVDRPAAVKTGTTNNWRDNWAIGYTPSRVVGVWMGNVDGQPMEDVSGVTGAGPVWHDVMLVAHRGLSPQPFIPPAGIIERTVCAEGGMLPTETCPETRVEHFIAGTEPTQQDTTHIRIAVDTQLGCRAAAGYPAERTTKQVFRLLPPEAENWAAMNGVATPPRDLCPAVAMVGAAPTREEARGAALARADAGAPAVLAPGTGAVFMLSSEIPRDRQRIELQAQAGDDAAELRFLIDGAAVAALNQPPYRALWLLQPGMHVVSVEIRDKDGARHRSAGVTFFVRG